MKPRRFCIAAGLSLAAVFAAQPSLLTAADSPMPANGGEYVTVRVPRSFLGQQAHLAAETGMQPVPLPMPMPMPVPQQAPMYYPVVPAPGPGGAPPSQVMRPDAGPVMAFMPPHAPQAAFPHPQPSRSAPDELEEYVTIRIPRHAAPAGLLPQAAAPSATTPTAKPAQPSPATPAVSSLQPTPPAPQPAEPQTEDTKAAESQSAQIAELQEMVQQLLSAKTATAAVTPTLTPVAPATAPGTPSVVKPATLSTPQVNATLNSQPAAPAAPKRRYVRVRIPRESLQLTSPNGSGQQPMTVVLNSDLFAAPAKEPVVQTSAQSNSGVQLLGTRPADATGSAFLEPCGAICGLDSYNNSCCPTDCCATDCCATDACGGCCGNNCCNQCCDPCHRCIVGIEATFLRARLDRASSSIATFDGIGNPLRNFSSDVVNDSNLNAAPRVWLGTERGCWGIIGRWFDYRAGDMDFGNPAYVPDAVGISQRLHAWTADVEVTRRYCCNDIWGRFSFGARRASIDTQTSATLTSPLGLDTLTGTAETHREFDGTGITFGFEGNKPIGDPCSGMSWYLLARGSVLWGDAYAASGTRTTFANGVGATLNDNFAVAATDEAEMTIAELQTGLQCTHKLECVPAVAFLRVGVEWQHWAGDADLVTGATSISAGAPGAAIIANASASQQTLDLVGLALSAGLTY